MAHHFICPNCGRRSSEVDRQSGLRRSHPGCPQCGFGFLFELMDDYYPAPDAAFFVCDQHGMLIACGRGAYELTGIGDEKAIGRPVSEVLGLEFESGEDVVATVLEWGVRKLSQPARLQAEGDRPTSAIADLFPAYDEDGGVMLVLTPAKS